MSLSDLVNVIKEQPISSVIERYIAIVRKNGTYKSVCPFHDDHDPSMSISDDKGLFKCFVCGAGGDAIQFVRRYKNLEFVDALKDASEKLGIDFSRYNQEKKKDPKLEMSLKILSKANQIYRKISENNDPDKPSVFQKFKEKRSLSNITIETHQLGFAPARNTLFEYLKSIPTESEREFAIKTALEIGILKQNEKNSDIYDTFRDRIMFPIWDTTGQTIGFTSRAIRDEQIPKYLNSRESLVFNKRNILYGYHLSKSSIREKNQVIIVEGNMDQISMFQQGFTNTVAIMGTAMSEWAIQFLKAITPNFILALDSDKAGWDAAIRINEILMRNGIIARCIEFSPDKDPDDYLQNQGPMALKQKLEDAQSFIDVYIDKNFPQPIPEIADRKLDILNKFFTYLAPLGDSLYATERITKLALRLKMTSGNEQIIRSYQEHLKTLKNKAPQHVHKKIEDQNNQNNQNKKRAEDFFGTDVAEELMGADESHLAYLEEEFNTITPSTIIPTSEKKLLEDLIIHPDILTHKNLNSLLDLIASLEVKRYVSELQKILFEIDDDEYSKILSQSMSGDYGLEITDVISAALFKYRKTVLDAKGIDKAFFEIKKNFELNQTKELIKEMKEKQHSVETETDSNTLLKSISELEKRLSEIKKQKPSKQL